MTVRLDRRSLLAMAGVASGVLANKARADQVAAPLKEIGRKFLDNGRVRNFAGNTIICHLAQQDAGFDRFDTILDIYRDLPTHTFSRKLAILPPSSYHMSIFGAALDQARKPGLWPNGIPFDAPLSECHARLMERLSSMRLECELPFRMKIETSVPAKNRAPLAIDLIPADIEQERKLRVLRNRISEVLGIREPGHDEYKFHITLCYQISYFDPAEQQEYETVVGEWISRLARRLPVLELGAPEFCTFEDMFSFRRRLLIV